MDARRLLRTRFTTLRPAASQGSSPARGPGRGIPDGSVTGSPEPGAVVSARTFAPPVATRAMPIQIVHAEIGGGRHKSEALGARSGKLVIRRVLERQEPLAPLNRWITNPEAHDKKTKSKRYLFTAV